MLAEPDPRQDSPERLAYEAYERGDQLFQIDLPVSGIQGRTGVSTASTRTWRPQVTDPLGVIERQGWRLENMSAAFVTTGSSATETHNGAFWQHRSRLPRHAYGRLRLPAGAAHALICRFQLPAGTRVRDRSPGTTRSKGHTHSPAVLLPGPPRPVGARRVIPLDAALPALVGAVAARGPCTGTACAGPRRGRRAAGDPGGTCSGGISATSSPRPVGRSFGTITSDHIRVLGRMVRGWVNRCATQVQRCPRSCLGCEGVDARDDSDDRAKAHVEDWLRSKGVTLTWDVAAAFRGLLRSDLVEHARYYATTDTDDAQVREIDVVAQCPAPRAAVTTCFVVECKSGDSKPWVLYQSESLSEFRAPRSTARGAHRSADRRARGQPESA